jgi:PAS domain S-box-containing protein
MKPLLVLLVEDEAELRGLLASFLERAHYRVIQAATGIEALQAAATQPPDLVISDVFMPGMDGYELVRSLRAHKLLSAIPVILISGVFTDEAALRLATSIGVHFLVKPFTRETLLASVAETLRCNVGLPSMATEHLGREHNRVLIDKLTEKVNALATSEERFRQMAESIGDVFWLADRTETQILYVSPAYEGIWGRSCESLYASPRSWADAIHPEDRRRVLEVEARQFVNGAQQHTYRIVRPDATIRWVQNRAFPVLDESGQIIRVAGVAKDITESREAEEKLRDSEARLRQSVKASNVGLWDWNLVSNEVYYSPEWKGQLGYAPEEISNCFEEWQSRVHPDDLARTLAKVQGAIQHPTANYALEFRLRHKNASYRWIFTQADVLRNESGQAVRMMGCHIDVTERKEAEQSLLDLSGRLMLVEDTERRRIAKELHDSTAQELVAVMMNLESLREGMAVPNSTEAKQLEDSMALVENAAHEIRTLSYRLHPPRLEEAGLIGAIRHYAAGFGERTGIATSVDLPPHAERLMEAVEIVLFRVVQECLGNIHRHAHSKTAFILLKHDASGIVLEVRDEGRGIPPQILEICPGRFTGLGVGIPGMRERLRFIGGNLEIDSSPRGTIIRAVVPGVAKPLSP